MRAGEETIRKWKFSNELKRIDSFFNDLAKNLNNATSITDINDRFNRLVQLKVKADKMFRDFTTIEQLPIWITDPPCIDNIRVLDLEIIRVPNYIESKHKEYEKLTNFLVSIFKLSAEVEKTEVLIDKEEPSPHSSTSGITSINKVNNAAIQYLNEHDSYIIYTLIYKNKYSKDEALSTIKKVESLLEELFLNRLNKVYTASVIEECIKSNENSDEIISWVFRAIEEDDSFQYAYNHIGDKLNYRAGRPMFVNKKISEYELKNMVEYEFNELQKSSRPITFTDLVSSNTASNIKEHIDENISELVVEQTNTKQIKLRNLVFINNGFILFDRIMNEHFDPEKGLQEQVSYYYRRMKDDKYVRGKHVEFTEYFLCEYGEKTGITTNDWKIKSEENTKNRTRFDHYNTALKWFKQQNK
jgi:hypothetical protein